MIRVTYDNDEYMFNNDAWSFANSEGSVSDDVASTLSVMAVESGVDPLTFSPESTSSPSRTKDSTAKPGRKSKNPKIKIFDN